MLEFLEEHSGLFLAIPCLFVERQVDLQNGLVELVLDGESVDLRAYDVLKERICQVGYDLRLLVGIPLGLGDELWDELGVELVEELLGDHWCYVHRLGRLFFLLANDGLVLSELDVAQVHVRLGVQVLGNRLGGFLRDLAHERENISLEQSAIRPCGWDRLGLFERDVVSVEQQLDGGKQCSGGHCARSGGAGEPGPGAPQCAGLGGSAEMSGGAEGALGE